MKERKYHHYFRTLLTIVAAASLSGCSWALFDSKGEIGIQERNLILTAIGLMLLVVIPAIVMTVMFAWRYRASNKDATYAPDWAHSYKIEAVVWGVPILIVAILAVVTWKTTHSLDPYKPIESDVKPLQVEVVSLNWKWLFIYPEQGIATVNELAFPENTPVTFHITSDTVMNTFSVPQLGGMVYAMAGQRTQLNLIANEPGEYFGQSGNYSGNGFSAMRFKAHVGSSEAFDSWVAKAKASSDTLDFDGFKVLAKPGEMVNHRYPIHPVTYYSQVQPGLFKQVIDQYVVGINSNKTLSAAAPVEVGVEKE
ncbi:ubiquinol oxidase subunit II [Azomonas macrocytogenes]|uniref:Ubiquinol oxidase subunit 2 n=1 Tax=Azomonas macrocytogenes TaxID=69962 RepID=A0A839T091_AZOMA|nr:ubiquinol oxidase subunit II [Azomonas macrocytogenes]MBB3101926.1 cytochrome o ubiquinol oxidase subunit 2 [Azomonas macrocytogenes]